MNATMSQVTATDRTNLSADEAKEIAKTIAYQIGGNRFVAMTGAKFSCDRNGALIVQLPANFARHSITRVEVHLDASDTYTMSFQRKRRGEFEEVDKIHGVYCDQLREVFTDVTGLKTLL